MIAAESLEEDQIYSAALFIFIAIVTFYERLLAVAILLLGQATLYESFPLIPCSNDSVFLSWRPTDR